MRAAIYARVSTERQGRDQTIDSQLDALRALGGRPTATNSKTITSTSTRAIRARGSTAPPSTASATPPARANSTSSASTAPTGSPAAMPTRSSCWRSSARPPATSSSSNGRSPTTRTTSSCSRSRGPSPNTSGPSSPSGSAAASCRRPGPGSGSAGQGPYGYRYVPRRDGVPGHLEIDEAEAEVVRMLYRWLIDERMTVRQILKRLAAGPWRPRNGKRLWSNSVVHRILSDPVYAGTGYANRHAFVVPRKPRSTGPRAGTPTCRQPRPREEWIPIPVPAIIDESTHRDAKSTIGPQLGPLVPQQHAQRVSAPMPAHVPEVADWRCTVSRPTASRRPGRAPLLQVPRQGHRSSRPGLPLHADAGQGR